MSDPLPSARDEAAGTPRWLPILGLAVLILGAAALVWQSATGAPSDSEQPAEADGDERHTR